ncbi:hypothetical protein HY251_05400 [bacterium]|nr:hypothetical protein [bacterium]
MATDGAFVITMSVQTLYLLLHDLISLPPLNDLVGLRARTSRRARLLVTAGNTLPSAAVLLFAIPYMHQPKPVGVLTLFGLYFALLFSLVFQAWYRPYFFGATAEEKRAWQEEYGHTHVLLPARGDNPRPNTMHLILHVLFLANGVLAALASLGI